MKITQIIIALVFGILIGFGLSKLILKNETSAKISDKKPTEAKPDTAQWKYDESLDAVKSSLNSHKIVYEDTDVRVLQVILDEHKTEPIHTHQYKSIMWFSQATPMVYYIYDTADKNKIKDSISIPQMPESALNVGGLVDPEGPHAVKNTGNRKGIAYRIEFKKEFK